MADLVPQTEAELALERIFAPTWETRVPTTMAIIQGKSAYLDQEGLPCCHSLPDLTTPEDPLDTRPLSDILASEQSLKRLNEPTEEDPE